MMHETNEYIIYYNDCDKNYINEFIFYFEKEKNRLFKFFDIEKLDKKLVIKLYDELDKYALYRNNKLFETSVGNMDVDDNYYYIHMLSYKEFVKRKGQEHKNIDGFFKLLIHEFVHVCHENRGSLHKVLIWISEGAAIFLSNQYDGCVEKLDNCILEDLLNDKRTWYINYYTLINSVYKKEGILYLRKLMFDPSFGKEQTSIIYNNYINKKDNEIIGDGNYE